ncbi:MULTISPECIES: ABC transporter ATP-binding protein [unclassified Rhodococcus (in: high G+C Gram-positive bacteria)]|uniref:ABC transporter ATP-binding protein n=1 Tax=unclassified Rhodococcus (in: high G+C Gram-positive bacteria) TaxID=192944 RepID=UPI000BCE5B4E|nr:MULTISPECIES: ATP-binding cassette domain-containing protein [unclassified Rhodococcus (in: high G+C Gram-positive bacteria)]MBP1161977.1 iron complex transport system ATP-binding protein [Rhodococcus sp. PvR099]PTR43312.1 iron complex transport system ATP-binding protein [Rhodococcus sp. OK611]SNX91175.1 iron complex transport system ATP-binding protein [Rhodococcus sp. OK270]
MTSPIVSTEAVTVVRDGRALISDISATIEPGQHWVLLGSNGAGKSTLLSLLGAQTHPTTGVVRVLGHRLGRVDMRSLRAAIGHVNPRHPLQYPLTVREVVLTGLTNTTELVQRWAPTPQQLDRADGLIATFGVADRSGARWPNLSQGERGRVLIARALMPEPQLLLLDEPSTGLDLAAREQLLTALDQVRRENPRLASVLVTHHIEEIPASTTHGILIRRGQVLAQGSIGEVLTSDLITECFEHGIEISAHHGRWAARALASV